MKKSTGTLGIINMFKKEKSVKQKKFDNKKNLPAKVKQDKSLSFTNKQIELIKSTVCPPGTTDNELAIFLHHCEKKGLDPLDRQIYMMKRKSKSPTTGEYIEKISIETSIDGLRLIAERTNKYEGQTPIEWCGKDGKWIDVWLSNDPPHAARAGVYKTGSREPIIAVARFSTYAQYTNNNKLFFNWQKMPDLMIAKCAEALALRKAFPQNLSDIYTNDEMNQMDDQIIDTVAELKIENDIDIEKIFKEAYEAMEKVQSIKELVNIASKYQHYPFESDHKISLHNLYESKFKEFEK